MENKIVVNVINKSNNPLPKYETAGAAGFDIRVDLSRVTPDTPIKGFGDAEVIWSGKGHTVPMIRIAPRSRALLPTGIFTAIPEGWQVSCRPRSGMSIKKGLTLVNTPGTIDADYRGEWHLPFRRRCPAQRPRQEIHRKGQHPVPCRRGSATGRGERNLHRSQEDIQLLIPDEMMPK